MNGFFGNQQLSPEELQRQLVAQRRSQAARARHMSMPNPSTQQDDGSAGHMHASAMADTHMTNVDSLDDIIRSNQQELQRRRSSLTHPSQAFAVPTTTGPDTGGHIPVPVPMAEFGASDDAYQGYQFSNMVSSPTDSVSGGFAGMSAGMAMTGVSTTFAQPNMMAMADQNDYSGLTTDMMGNVIGFSNLNMGALPPDPAAPLDIFGPSHTAAHMDPLSTDFGLELDPENLPLSATSAEMPGGLGLGGTGRDDDENEDEDEDMLAGPELQAPPHPQMLPDPRAAIASPTSQPTPGTPASFRPTPAAAGSGLGPMPAGMAPNALMTPSLASPVSVATQPTSAAGPSRTIAQEKSLYSKSGFDMMRALWYVATRKNPEVQLGAVDMSCAFVVCDVTLNDCPIVYVSDNFQNLTGYSRHEIVGQNCRFLQAPSGKVEAGSRREFVENSAVFSLKRKIAEGKEVQQSLINYRKGGKPFLNLLTMIPIPWDTEEVRYFVGFQIDLVECPDAITGQETGGMQINYKHSDIGQYIWTPPPTSHWERESGQTLGVDDVSTLLQQFNPKGIVSDWHKQSWDKMLLENADDVVHVLSLKGLFLYLSPSCKRVLEYDAAELVGSSLSSICHPSDIVPVTRELKETAASGPVNIVFRIRRKLSGYTWFESHGSLFVEQGKGRKSIILVGRRRPVFVLYRRDFEANGGIGDSELWTKLSTSGMFLFVSSSVRSLLDLQPEALEGTSIQDLMRKESRAEFGRAVEKARRGKIVTCKHEVHNRRGQVLQAQTVLYPGDAAEGQKPSFLLAQTKLLKASSSRGGLPPPHPSASTTTATATSTHVEEAQSGAASVAAEAALHQQAADSGAPAPSGIIRTSQALASQDAALAADDNIFGELKTTRCTSWQFELRQMEKMNRVLAEELGQLLSSKKKRKRRKGVGNAVRDCANCHTRNTPEWRRGPSGQRDLCNSCGLRWAKQTGRVSPRNSSRGGNDTQSKKSNSPIHSSPLQREIPAQAATDTAIAAAGTAAQQQLHSGKSELPSNAASAGALATANMVSMGLAVPLGSTAGAAGAAAAGGAGGSGGAGGATGVGGGGKGHQQHPSIPPPSQPGLDHGSGVMTSIREEREQSS